MCVCAVNLCMYKCKSHVTPKLETLVSELHFIKWSDLQGVTVTPTNGANIVVAISLQFGVNISFLFAVAVYLGFLQQYVGDANSSILQLYCRKNNY